jgi:Fe-S-cluster containining protein
LDIQKIIGSYREVLEDVSLEANRLEKQYEEYMVCRKGCSDCCTDISLLPLEWYALRERVRASKEPFIQERQPGSCALLKDRICSFYPSRPLICRTHGLPLLYLAEEYDKQGDQVESEEPDWQISWCDLNFTTVSEETMEEIFDPEDVLNMEEWNTRLKTLNLDFLETREGAPFREKRRIPLQEIFKEFS